jgi:hypothetical protein
MPKGQVERGAMVEVTIEEGGASIEDGDTVIGTVSGTDTDTWNSGEDGMILYYEITIDGETVPFEFSPSYNLGSEDSPRVTPSTELGAVLRGFGVDLTIGETFDLDDVFSSGTEVAFEVEEVEGSDGGTYYNCDKTTLRPADQADDEPAGTGDDESGDEPESDDGNEIEQSVMKVVAENIGEAEKEVKKELAQMENAGELLSTYKTLKSEGTIWVDDGVQTE